MKFSPTLPQYEAPSMSNARSPAAHVLPLAYSWSETLAPASALSAEITGGLHTPSAEHSLEAGQSLLRTHSTDAASRHMPWQLPAVPPHS